MLDYKFDTQLLIEGENLSEEAISSYFSEHFEGDCLIAVGYEELIKIHFHTNEPWKVLEYCASLGRYLRYRGRKHGTAGKRRTRLTLVSFQIGALAHRKRKF